MPLKLSIGIGRKNVNRNNGGSSFIDNIALCVNYLKLDLILRFFNGLVTLIYVRIYFLRGNKILLRRWVNLVFSVR